MSRYRLRLQSGELLAVATLLLALAGCAPKQVGVVLTYQVDATPASELGPVNMDQLVAAVNGRLRRAGAARKVDDELLEVDLYGDVDETKLESIKRLVGSAGILEFRIIADGQNKADKPIIEKAKLLPADETKLTVDGKKVAEWLEYSEPEFGPVDMEHGGMVKRLARDVPQALVLIDRLNVTGNYLASATQGFDERGNHAIVISFNQEGARRFGMLTSQNLPTSANGTVARRLGIILDKKLLSAPEIHARISDRAMISGSKMTKNEVETAVEILNAGSLPYPIKIIGERRTAN